jgi:hypothetical protein
MPGFLDMFNGTPARTEQLPLLSTSQQQLQNQSIQQLLNLLQGKGGTEGFNPIEQRARNQFATQTVPSIAERFSALGGQGGQRSSAFKGALGSAASGLESDLAAQRSMYGQNQLQNLLPFAGRSSFENIIHERQPGFGEQLGQGVSGGLGGLLPLLGLLLGGTGLSGLFGNQPSAPSGQGSMNIFRSPASQNSFGYNNSLNFGQSPNVMI